MTRCACLLSVLSLLTVGCSPFVDDDATTQGKHAIYHGDRESGEEWVVAVHYTSPDTGNLRLCTGSLIAPNAVLTAKHCIFHQNPDESWVELDLQELTVSVTDDMTSPDGPKQALGVASVWTTPEIYSRQDALDGKDIAVLELDGNVEGVTPVDYAREAPAQDTDVDIIGFGLTQDDVLGQKHSASATVNEVNEFTFETGGTSWTCTGDSGGPARAADGTIVGVTSIGTSGCNDDVSYYVRVDRYATAIKVFLDTKAPPSCQTEQGCDVYLALTEFTLDRPLTAGMESPIYFSLDNLGAGSVSDIEINLSLEDASPALSLNTEQITVGDLATGESFTPGEQDSPAVLLASDCDGEITGSLVIDVTQGGTSVASETLALSTTCGGEEPGNAMPGNNATTNNQAGNNTTTNEPPEDMPPEDMDTDSGDGEGCQVAPNQPPVKAPWVWFVSLLGLMVARRLRRGEK